MATHQDPPDRHASFDYAQEWLTIAIPQGCAAAALYLLHAAILPEHGQGFPGVAVSWRRSARLGRRLPLRGGRPSVPGWRCGGASLSTASRRRGAIRRTQVTGRTLWFFMCGRGTHEKVYGELKGGFAFDCLPPQRYHANSAWQVSSFIAFNLMRAMQAGTARRPFHESKATNDPAV